MPRTCSYMCKHQAPAMLIAVVGLLTKRRAHSSTGAVLLMVAPAGTLEIGKIDGSRASISKV